MLNQLQQKIEQETGLSLKLLSRKRKYAYPRYVYFKVAKFISDQSNDSISKDLGFSHVAAYAALLKFYEVIPESKEHYDLYKKMLFEFQDHIIYERMKIEDIENVKEILGTANKKTNSKAKNKPQSVNGFASSKASIAELIEMIPECSLDIFKETKLIPFVRMAQSDYKRLRK